MANSVLRARFKQTQEQRILVKGLKGLGRIERASKGLGEGVDVCFASERAPGRVNVEY